MSLPIFIRLTQIIPDAADVPLLLNVATIGPVSPGVLESVFRKERHRIECTIVGTRQVLYHVRQSVDVIQTLIEEAVDRVLFAGEDEEPEEPENSAYRPYPDTSGPRVD